MQEPLIRVIENHREYIKLKAISSLGQIGDAKAVEALIRVTEGSYADSIKDRAGFVLKKIEGMPQKQNRDTSP